MGLASRFLRTPKPKKFIGILSLSTGASLITLSLMLNKLSGVYGILALLTGYHLSPFQLSMYIYSIFALILTVVLTPHIKTQSPLHCLALAWFYVLDSIINAAYTAAFAVTWFLVLLQHQAGKDAGIKGPGAGTINDTAGFTDPQHNVTKVEVIATPQVGDISLGSGQDAVAAAQPGSAPAGVGSNDVILGRESINSIGIIITLWTIRAYFCLVMLSWARMVLRQHIARSGGTNPHAETGTASTSEKGQAEDPFAESKLEGQGWQRKLGRFMISLGRSYWLGTDENESWMSNMPDRFRTARTGSAHSTQNAYQTGNGVVLGKIEANPERERRRRSGTGPPLPSVQAQAGVISDGEDAGSDGGAGTALLNVPERTNV